MIEDDLKAKIINDMVKGQIEKVKPRVNAPKWGVFRSIETRIANLIVIID